MTFAETDDVDVNRSAPSLDDADGLWPMEMELMELMVMELFTKIQLLICELLPAMLPLMLHLSGRELALTTVAMIVHNISWSYCWEIICLCSVWHTSRNNFRKCHKYGAKKTVINIMLKIVLN